MTNYPGPPSYPGPAGPPPGPPYGAPPYGRAPARGSSTTTVLTALAAALFVVATALAAWGVHAHDTKTGAGAPGLRGGTVLPGSTGDPGVPAAAGASSFPASGTTTGIAVPSSAVPSIAVPSITPYVPPPTPTHQPLDPEAVNRTFQVYMNALLYRSLSQLKSATCPKLRHTETGTALDHKYINRWQGHAYTIYNDRDYVTIAATVRYVDPNTGGNGGTHV